VLVESAESMGVVRTVLDKGNTSGTAGVDSGGRIA